jgi:predicted N-acetyltransferase YhbS
MIHISQEAPAEVGAREALLDRALGPGRFLKPSEQLRRGRRPADGLALVARLGADIVGSVRLWHIAASDGRPALLLGPLAVDPDRHRIGIGSALMETAIAGAAALGHSAVLLVGDPPYYARFGFSAEHTQLLKMPAPVLRKRFLGLELQSGALAGAAGKLVSTGKPTIAPLTDAGAMSLVA